MLANRSTRTVPLATMAAAFVAGLWGASCSEEVRWDNACERVFRKHCRKEVACGAPTDVVTCQEEISRWYVCDPEATIADLDGCATAADAASCGVDALDGLCSEICSAETGCDRPGACTETETTMYGGVTCAEWSEEQTSVSQ